MVSEGPPGFHTHTCEQHAHTEPQNMVVVDSNLCLSQNQLRVPVMSGETPQEPAMNCFGLVLLLTARLSQPRAGTADCVGSQVLK